MADSILHVHYLLGVYAIVQFLADRTNSCTYATMHKHCVCLSSVTLCIVVWLSGAS